MNKKWLVPSLLPICVATAPAMAQSTPESSPSAQQLEQQVEQMSKQLEAMKTQLDQMKKQQDAVVQQQQAQAVAASAAPTASGSSPFENLSLWGYGEVYYTRPIHEPSLTQADLARAVFGIGYRFNDNTIFNSEFEVEHAVSSASDPGEFEVEQFYVDHQINNWASVEGGLFLIPTGLINEHHEPTAFYGVQRNFVETLIIPSTWREGGFAFHGNTPFGLNWAAGLTTGLNISKWDINPEDPPYRTALDLEDSDVAPMQAAHQELALADAQHLSQFASLNYQGLPGLLAGGSVFTGNMTVPIQPPGLPNERVTLWELHSRWTPGKFDFSALYARGTFTNTAAYNTANAGASNLIPSRFQGYYAQAAYNLWQHGDYRFSPFVRWERYDMASSFEGVPAGISPYPTGPTSDGGVWPTPDDRVWTYGANFYITPHVVLKADYQNFKQNSNFSRFDLGLGLAF